MSEKFGDLNHEAGYVTAVMEREVPNSSEEVWKMLSDESQRVKWLAPGSIDMQAGGRAKLDFSDSYVVVDSEVTACEAPNVLAFSWSGPDDPDRPVRFDIRDTDYGALIKLSVSIPDNEVVGRSCAGWEAHLTMMQAALAEVPIKFPLDRFKVCRDQFDKLLTEMMMSENPFLKL